MIRGARDAGCAAEPPRHLSGSGVRTGARRQCAGQCTGRCRERAADRSLSRSARLLADPVARDRGRLPAVRQRCHGIGAETCDAGVLALAAQHLRLTLGVAAVLPLACRQGEPSVAVDGEAVGVDLIDYH